MHHFYVGGADVADSGQIDRCLGDMPLEIYFRLTALFRPIPGFSGIHTKGAVGLRDHAHPIHITGPMLRRECSRPGIPTSRVVSGPSFIGALSLGVSSYRKDYLITLQSTLIRQLSDQVSSHVDQGLNPYLVTTHFHEKEHVPNEVESDILCQISLAKRAGTPAYAMAGLYANLNRARAGMNLAINQSVYRKEMDLNRIEFIWNCQSACKRDPLSARKRDPLSRWRKVDRTRAFALRAA